jgi:hypothetical protein
MFLHHLTLHPATLLPSDSVHVYAKVRPSIYIYTYIHTYIYLYITMQAMQKPYGGRDQEISSSKALLGVLLATGLRNVHSTQTQHRSQDRYSTLTHPPPPLGGIIPFRPRHLARSRQQAEQVCDGIPPNV